MRADVVWGMKMGSKAAIAACLLALAGMSLAGPGPFETVGGFDFFGVAAIYLVTGPLLGGVVGWQRPLAQTKPGRMLLGLVCGTLFGGMIMIAAAGLPWTSEHTATALLCGLAGAIRSRWMRRPRRR